VDHHFALATLFEIMDVASRADLKSDLLKDLDRHRMAS
jgi:cell division protein ZapD